MIQYFGNIDTIFDNNMYIFQFCKPGELITIVFNIIQNKYDKPLYILSNKCYRSKCCICSRSRIDTCLHQIPDDICTQVLWDHSILINPNITRWCDVCGPEINKILNNESLTYIKSVNPCEYMLFYEILQGLLRRNNNRISVRNYIKSNKKKIDHYSLDNWDNVTDKELFVMTSLSKSQFMQLYDWIKDKIHNQMDINGVISFELKATNKVYVIYYNIFIHDI